ncbi:VOC family protein [Brevundimonas variabilis]|uniref:Catechol 2,3-dioxygenase-like lactoylglutathione lyase family enzyme n=1 Tax=Brevundimonas variabilis TaxID=74312 RepID=A0A7W9CJM6_9CAUL|nr:VOC family protein [Brevundimonas variabilis]MBB5746643.1 catechol 2,3-dioxygenase-like lactoylglutathione lyase family enzyme [Brevundimonas variabilis]
MFTHVTVGANDVEASRAFYDAALGALGIDPGQGPDAKGRYWWRTPRGAFAVGKPIDGEDACHANGGTIGFAATKPEMIQAFHDAGVAHGGKAIEDPPGERVGAFGTLNLAYLRDPSGNKICAMYRVG